MKIRKIQFKNINSLRGEHAVDFTSDPLQSAGLFAITGPTGSGKTTLLDVISLALYNNIPRMEVNRISNTIIEKSGSVMTRNTTEAYASVEYECARGIFTSKWSISTARTGNLREYHMEISDDTNTILDVKRSVVPGKNEELIGLSYEQFIRSMVLAQGEFAKFLKSNKADRGALLEKITGTEIYRKLGIKAFEKFREHGQLLDNMRIQEETLSKDLLPEEERQKVSDQLNESEREIKKMQDQQKVLLDHIKLKGEISATKLRIANSLVSEKEADDAFTSFEQDHGIKLKTHETLLPLEEDLRLHKQLSKNINSLIAGTILHNTKLKTAKEQKNTAYAKIALFAGKEATDKNLIPTLDELETRVLELNDELRTTRSEYANKKQLASEKGRDIHLDIPDVTLEKDLDGFKNLKEQYGEEIKSIAVKLTQRERTNPDNQLELIMDQKQKVNAWAIYGGNQKTRKQQITESENGIALLKEKLQKQPGQISKQEDKIKISILEFEQLQKEDQIRRLRAKYDEDRKQLVKGDPCPLCGSEEHPFVTHYEVLVNDLAKQIIHKQAEVRKDEADLVVLNQDLKNKNIQIEKLHEQLEEDKTSLKEIEEEIAKIAVAVPESLRSKTPDEILDTLSEKETYIKSWIETNKKYSKLQELLPVLEEMLELYVEVVRVRKDIEKLYKGNDIRNDINRLKEGYNQADQAVIQVNNRIKDIEQNISKDQSLLEEKTAFLKVPLKEKGFHTPEEALSQLLPGEAYSKLVDKRNSLKGNITRQKDARKIFEQDLLKMKEKDCKASLEEIEETEKNLDTQIIESQSSRDELFATNRQQEKLKNDLSQLADLMADEKAKNEKWVLLKEYIGDATGNKFANFAQELTLRHLVGLANKRMKNLSQRYLLDLPEDEKEEDNLVVVDEDMGGMRRSVKTLSGGESFLVSLSLALALSDLASKNVDIQSLFIDEGFGTLDPETLDLVLDTLENIQANSDKTIGVISHVEALKERITTQIAVHPNGQGYSFLKIS